MYLWIVRVISYKHKKEPTFRLIPFICLEFLTLKRRLSTLPLLRSTIDVVGLNFSVRNGKRWIPNAITTLISCFLHLKMFDWTTPRICLVTMTRFELTPFDALQIYQPFL